MRLMKRGSLKPKSVLYTCASRKEEQGIGFPDCICFPLASVLIVVAPGSTRSVNTCILMRQSIEKLKRKVEVIRLKLLLKSL